MGAVREWANERKRALVALLVGAAFGTILWFGLNPFLTDKQKAMVTWLLWGSYLVVVVVSLIRVRRKRDQGRSL